MIIGLNKPKDSIGYGVFFFAIYPDYFENLTFQFEVLLEIIFFGFKTNHLKPIWV